MVLGVVDGVDTDGVDTELDELLDIALAAISVGDGVLVGRGATRLVVNTTNVEAVAIGGVEGWTSN